MSLQNKLFLLSFLVIVLQGCMQSKKTIQNTSSIINNKSIKFHHDLSGSYFIFNPTWIIENNIESIIEKRSRPIEGKLWDICYNIYDKDGYLKSRNFTNKKLDIENEIIASSHYITVQHDSFAKQTFKTIKYYDRGLKLTNPDTIDFEFKDVIHKKKTNSFLDELIIESDSDEGLTYSIENEEKSEFTLYVEIFTGQRIGVKFIMDNFGRITRIEGGSTSELKYDKNGTLRSLSNTYSDEVSTNITYGYKKRDSR